jgi:hypothetical protein
MQHACPRQSCKAVTDSKRKIVPFRGAGAALFLSYRCAPCTALSKAQEAEMAASKRSGGRRRKYGPKAGNKVERSMHEMKRGKLRSGRSGRKVKSRKQAIAIGLSEARESGAKVPPKKSASAGRKSSSKRGRTARKRSSSRRSGSSARQSAKRTSRSRRRAGGRKSSS